MVHFLPTHRYSGLHIILPNDKIIVWDDNAYFQSGGTIGILNQPKTGSIKYVKQVQHYDFLDQMTLTYANGGSKTFDITINPLTPQMLIGAFQCYVSLSFSAQHGLRYSSFNITGILNNEMLYSPQWSGSDISGGDYSGYGAHYSILPYAQNMNRMYTISSKAVSNGVYPYTSYTLNNILTVYYKIDSIYSGTSVTWNSAAIDIVYTGAYLA